MDSAPPPVPMADPLTQPFWDGTGEHRLLIQRCTACGTYIHLPRPVCRNCLSFDLDYAEVSGRGTLYSFTITHKVFHPYFADQAPYVLATIELDEQSGLMFLANIVDIDHSEVRIGMELHVGFEPLGPDHTIPVFRAKTAGVNASSNPGSTAEVPT